MPVNLHSNCNLSVSWSVTGTALQSIAIEEYRRQGSCIGKVGTRDIGIGDYRL